MLYVVLATGRSGETGIEERFFQAQKTGTIVHGWFGRHPFQRPATADPARLTFESTRTDAVFTLGPEEGEPLCSARSHVSVENWTRVGYSAGVTGRQFN
jgi:hypothetical protein